MLPTKALTSTTPSGGGNGNRTPKTASAQVATEIVSAQMRYYNRERAHSGRWTKGRTPEEVLTTWPP
jgi:hypothetical protein